MRSLKSQNLLVRNSRHVFNATINSNDPKDIETILYDVGITVAAGFEYHDVRFAVGATLPSKFVKVQLESLIACSPWP